MKKNKIIIGTLSIIILAALIYIISVFYKNYKEQKEINK